VLCLFNRPDRARAAVDALRPVRPRTVLAIADGPRATHPDDPARCAAARAALATIDWPCEVVTHFADTNMGCDRRIPSGLDWAFSHVGRAIVLEDDILPHPSFFGWMAGMLDRFEQDSTVAFVSGWNPHIVWGERHSDHIRSTTAGLWGWGVTASAWQRIWIHPLDGTPDMAAHDISALNLDEVLAAYWALQLQLCRLGRVAAWDVLFSLRAGLLGLDAISSPRNLVRNVGFGTHATHTQWTDDFRALILAGEAPPSHRAEHQPARNRAFDRAMVLGLLLVACRNPTISARLATRVARGTSLPLDDATRLHLLPFLLATESLELLAHLAAQGVTSAHLVRLAEALRSVAPGNLTA
jgi:hypothetical protein